MLEKFLSLSRFRQIALCVFSLHLLTVAAMAGHHWATRRLRPAKPIAVRTIQPKALQPADRPTQVAVKTAPQTKAAPKPAPVSKPVPKPASKPTPKTAAVKKPAPPKPIPKKEAQPKPLQEENTLLVSAPEMNQETIQETKRPPLTLPAPLASSSLKPETEPEPNLDLSYGETLTLFLQSELILPEPGDVKAQIAIDASGKLVSCEILDARSAKNEEFLKNRLPELAFPCFNRFGIAGSTQTFTISFCNVETR